MAVVQISRIQHRRGLEQDFPQLAAAEFGWSIDTRRLFIGNGLPSEGSPAEGTTEILTVYTDLLGLLKTYSYKGVAGGTTVITGASVMAPVTRTLQVKLDEHVSVRDFGAQGDGISDDTEAIQRALTNLWPTESFAQAYSQHRTLYFPAGVYIISGDVIKIPPFTKLVGDGNFSTRIKQIDAAQAAVFRFSDSYYQTETFFGIPDPIFNSPPETSNYYISDMVLERTSAHDCVIIDGGANIVFDRCHFVSKAASPVRNGTPLTDTGSACVRIIGKTYLSLYAVKNTVFNNCTFRNASVGLKIDGQAFGTSVIGCYFTNLHRAVTMGENSGGRDIPSTTLYPRSVSLTGNYFDVIADRAVQSYADSGVVMSSGNLYEHVGYDGYKFEDLQVTICPVLEFASHGCSSANDSYIRSLDERYSNPVIEDNGFQANYVDAFDGFQLGRLYQSAGVFATLNDAATTANVMTNSLGINVYVQSPATVSYVCERNGVNRTGYMRVNWTGTDIFWDEEYSESADIGVQFSATVGNEDAPVVLYYTSTATGFVANLRYDIRFHTANNAPL